MKLYVVHILINGGSNGYFNDTYVEVLPKAFNFVEEAVEYMREYNLESIKHLHLTDPYDDFMSLDDRFRFVASHDVTVKFSICEVEW